MNAGEGYRRAVSELEALGIMPDRAPSLDPMREGLRRIGAIKLDPSRVVIVAGTNGKGSVSATLEALLLSAGERVGLYTSPHLVETSERFRLNGLDIDPSAFSRLYQTVRGRTGDLKLSHFEMLTLMAAHWFGSGEMQPPVDRLILEVGLGGTWDATNAIPHGFCVITRLGLDHQGLLGRSLAEIARNKFGVVPKKGEELSGGAVVVHAPLPADVRAIAGECRKKTESRWVGCMPYECVVKEPKKESEKEPENSEPMFLLRSEYGLTPIALPGPRGCENTAVALTAFKELGFDPARHLDALSKVRWPGRMERFAVPGCAGQVYLSGDHNLQGLESLLELLNHYRRKRIHFVVGIGKDKDAESMLGLLDSVPGSVIYLTVTPFKGRSLGEYGAWTERGFADEDPGKAFSAALHAAQAGDLVIVTGSLYLVGAIRARLARSD